MPQTNWEVEAKGLPVRSPRVGLQGRAGWRRGQEGPRGAHRGHLARVPRLPTRPLTLEVSLLPASKALAGAAAPERRTATACYSPVPSIDEGGSVKVARLPRRCSARIWRSACAGF